MLCLDTYALFEIMEENPKYSKIIDEEFVIPDSTLAEFYNLLHRRVDEKTAQLWLEKFKPYARPITLDIWIKAVRHRALNHSKNLSMFDCLGYLFSLENGYLFVTGDKEFAGAKGVEYIKK